MLQVGLVGLPNVGKSTLFNALSKKMVPSDNYPFCTIEPNIAIVEYEDERVDFISKIYNSQKTVKPSIEFVDIAGLVKGASKGEGLGNKFLDNISKVDAIAHIVRAFDDDNISHVSGTIDPTFDAEVVDLELIQKDIDTINKRYEKTFKLARAGNKDAKYECNLLEELKKHLENSNPSRTFKENRTEKDNEIINSLFLITEKPVIYVANVDEEGLIKDNNYVIKLREYAKSKNAKFYKISAKLEMDLMELDDEEKEIFMEEFKIKGNLIDNFVKLCKDTLNLITFITGTENESKSWNVLKGVTAYEAAGKIHTDIQSGFIKAEVINYNDLKKIGNFKEAKEKGKISIEGKDYILKEGDCVYFHFHV